MLGLGYPGGPEVDRLAATGTAGVPFPRPDAGRRAGILVLRPQVGGAPAISTAHPDAPPADVAASFVAACMDVLVTKCRRALAEHRSQCLVIVGGVAASPQLRAAARELCAGAGVGSACRRCAGRPTTAR